MPKLNHQRPTLRFLDSIRREIGRDARKAVLPSDGVVSKDNMPTLSNESGQLVLGMLNAASEYLDRESDLMFARPTPKAARRQGNDKQVAADAARAKLEESCFLVVERAFTGERQLWKWVKWYERRLIEARDLTGLDIVFEYGLKPALVRFERKLFGET